MFFGSHTFVPISLMCSKQSAVSHSSTESEINCFLIYRQFRVTGTHDSIESYTDVFIVVLRNVGIQEFDSKWDGILSMTKIPPDDILEGLYKLRIQASDKLKTVLELYDLETHQKKLGPDYHRLKAMVKRSIE